MKKLSIITLILFSAISIILSSCGGGSNPEASMQEDAEKYVKIKCENRTELSKFANDPNFSKEELDSVRRIYNKDLKKIKNKYNSDEELQKKFDEAVMEALETVPECNEHKNVGKRGKERK